MYKANDCNSILKYIEIMSPLEIKNDAPHVVNNTINEYSGIVGNLVFNDCTRLCHLYFRQQGPNLK